VEVSPLSLLDALSSGRGEELAKSIRESDYVVFRAYMLPRPQLKVRTWARRLVRLGEGELARLEYSLFYALYRAAKEGRRPTFREYADLAGNWRAAAGYLVELWRSGLVSFSDESRILDLYTAYATIRRKGYARRISRCLNLEYTVDKGSLEKQPYDDIKCIYYDGKLLCKYIVSSLPRSQAKAEVRAAADALFKQ